MDARLNQINKTVRTHDRKLFAKRVGSRVDIMRESYRFMPYDLDGIRLLVSVPSPHQIFSLTDNWTVSGKPVEWGLEPISHRLKAMDLWNREDFMEELLKEYEKDQESEKRSFRNNIESFLRDFRREFSGTFNDVNTSTLEKVDSRRKRERK